MQDMTVDPDPATPVKQAPVPISMWEGVAAKAILGRPAEPGDIVIMTIDRDTKINVGLPEAVSVWGCVGRVVHHSKGHPDHKDYTVAVLAICNTDLSTTARLI